MMAEFDIVLYGATGYTGRLVAEHIARHHGGTGLRWAIAGRSAEKLAAVRDAVGGVPTIAVDAGDRAGLDALAARTRAVISTAGPYAQYGNDLVAAAVAAGIAYLDLTGEPHWIRAMIDAHEDDAKASGARVLFSCGFDSIPSDLGVWTLQEAAIARHGRPAALVEGRMTMVEGHFSGGTIASLRGAGDVPRAQMFDPFLLTPGFRGPDQPKGAAPKHDEAGDRWAAPFVMAPINTKAVHRTNFLLGHPYGADFRYEEMLDVGTGERGRKTAEGLAGGGLMKLPDLKPGDGPTPEQREAGSYSLALTGSTEGGETISAVVTGDRDPGYGSTSKIIAETALCLLDGDFDRPGIWTPAALMGAALRARLTERAGMTFEVR